MTDYVVGFDVGGTRLKAGAVSRSGRWLARRVAPSEAHRGPRFLLARLAAEVRAFHRRLGTPPRAVGLALPGAVRPDRGVVLLPGRLRDLEGFPLVPRLRRAAGDVPVVADNDARSAMIAEWKYGWARGRRWALTVTIGTGVGSGVLLDGRILRDPHLQFGTQMSHITIQAAGGRRCLTGSRGTAEMLCSATALAQQVRDGLARGIPSKLSELYRRDPHAVDFEAVLRAAAQGDPLCRDELAVWTANLGWFLVSAIHVYAPEIVILGGGAARGARAFLGPLRAHLRRHVYRWPPGEPVPLRVSRLPDHAGVLGAAALAWEVAP
ncbi:MAG TPA: ROK family protein [Planctomycetota bacterium]|nr:ROK family protein [Planctomycetota bacterium]